MSYRRYAVKIIDGTTLVDCRLDLIGDGSKYLYPQEIVILTAWTHGTDFLKITDRGGNEVSWTNAESKGLVAGQRYPTEIVKFRSSAANETGFSILCLYSAVKK